MRIPHFILFLLLAPLSAAGQTLQQREAERLADEAYVLEQGGHYAHASDLYARAYAKDDNPQYLLRAANTMQLAGRAGSALTLYGQFLAEDPQSQRRREVQRIIRTLRPRAIKTHGEVIFESEPPGALVELLGKKRQRLGVTPLRAWLPHGKISVAVTVVGHPAQLQTVTVAGDHIATVKTVGKRGAKARPAKGALRVHGAIRDAKVSISGQRVITATGTRAWRVNAGKHTVRVERKGKPVFEAQVIVRADGETSLSIP